MKKKHVSIFFLILPLILASCTTSPVTEPSVSSPVPTASPEQDTPTDTSDSTETACPDGAVEISMDDWSNADEAFADREEVITAFEEAHPCINVIFVNQLSFGADAHRLEQIRSGTASDLIAVESVYIPIYTESGGLADLSPFVEADPDLTLMKYISRAYGRLVFIKRSPVLLTKISAHRRFTSTQLCLSKPIFHSPKKAGLTPIILKWL